MEVPWAPPTQHFGSFLQCYSSNAGIARRRHFLVDFDWTKEHDTIDITTSQINECVGAAERLQETLYNEKSILKNSIFSSSKVSNLDWNGYFIYRQFCFIQLVFKLLFYFHHILVASLSRFKVRNASWIKFDVLTIAAFKSQLQELITCLNDTPSAWDFL